MAMKQSGNMGYEKFCIAMKVAETTIVKLSLEGTARKALVTAIAEIIGAPIVYQKISAFTYIICDITIDENENLIA